MCQVAVFKQERRWDLLIEKFEPEIMNEHGVLKLSKGLLVGMVIPDDEKDQSTTLSKKIKDKEAMPTHWYVCRCIRHRMRRGVDRLKEIDASILKSITSCFCAFFLSLTTRLETTGSRNFSRTLKST